MATLILIRSFPAPNILFYSIVSFSLLLCASIWTHNNYIEQQFHDEMEELYRDDVEAINKLPDIPSEESNHIVLINDINNESTTKDEDQSKVTAKHENKDATDIERSDFTSSAHDYSTSAVFNMMLNEPVCLAIVVNAAYCFLLLVAQLILKIVFGKLRGVERQHLKDKFWNFVFYKFIFIFGVMNVQSVSEVLIWVSWFTAIAFLLLLTKLCKDRFEFLSFSPNTPAQFHWKVISLLIFILMSCCGLVGCCLTYNLPFAHLSSNEIDIHSMTFMLAESILIGIKAMHVFMRYAIHLYDIRHADLWEHKATFVYHVDLSMELSSLILNFFHHMHMLFSGNIWLSMASLVICMQLRYIFSEIQKRLLRHKHYCRVVANMEAQFPAATAEEIKANDQCAICWDQMETARKLPCGHLFHAPCLRSWLEQDTSCPTCRKQLGIRTTARQDIENNNDVGPVADLGGIGVNISMAPPIPAQQQRNHFWHFDGSRFASWLPSFSVEVMHSTTHRGQTPNGDAVAEEATNSQLDSMVREIHDIFPQIPVHLIRNDLRTSGSVEATTDNILENRIEIPTASVHMTGGQQQQQNQSIPNVSTAGWPLPTADRPVFTASDVRRRMQQLHMEISAINTPSTATTTAYPVPDVSGLRRRHTTFNTNDDTINSNDPAVQGTSSHDVNLPSTSASSSSMLGTGTLDSATTSDNDDVTDETNTTTPPPSITSVPGHFSKSPSERQNMLMQRREILLKQARERYLKTNQDRKTKEQQQAAAAASSSSDGEFPLANFNTNDRRDNDIDSISPSTHFPPVAALPLQNFLQRRSFSSESDGSNDDDDQDDDDDDLDQVFGSDTDDSDFSDDSII